MINLDQEDLKEYVEKMFCSFKIKEEQKDNKADEFRRVGGTIFTILDNCDLDELAKMRVAAAVLICLSIPYKCFPYAVEGIFNQTINDYQNMIDDDDEEDNDYDDDDNDE